MFKAKKGEEEERVVENMRGDGELDMLLNEILHITSPDHHLHHQNNNHLVSPISSSSFSGGSSSSEDGFSPSMAQMDHKMFRSPSTHYLDSLVVKNSNEHVLDEPAFCDNLRRLNVGEARKDYSKVRRFPIDPYGFGFGFGFGGCNLDGPSPCNFENYRTFDGFNSDIHGYGGFQSSIPGNSVSSDDDTKAKILGLCQGYNAGNLMGSHLTHNHSNALYSEHNCYKGKIDYVMDQRNQQRRLSCNGGLQLHNPSMNLPNLNDELSCSRKLGMGFYRDRSPLNPVNSSQLVYPNLVPICNNNLVLKEKTRAIPNGSVPPSLLSITDAGDVEAFSCEDSFIIQGKSLKHVVDKGCNRSKGQKKKSSNEIAMHNRREKRQELHGQSQLKGICKNSPGPRSYSPLLLQPTFSSLAQIQGCMYFMAKDQHGCRFLQKIFDEGTSQDVQIIFNEIINHVVELMMNSFGNYLMQKLLEVCSEEQRMHIVLMVTEGHGDLIRVSLNAHGTRVVQKLIETLKTRQQVLLVVQALEPGFLDLIKDLNGNHVIQRCLQCLRKEDNKFIFDAAAKFCVNIATHQHGCCVLNRCIDKSEGKYQEKLVAEIAAHALILAQDAFGNYVVQYIIEFKTHSAAASLISQFEGHYVYLSMQKFSSHVVEKCLKFFEESRPRIIHELLSVPHFEQLLQDPFANYVIQSALEHTKGSLHASLVEAVRPHTFLRTSPYCKKIFSRNLLKK
ncbi:uncharacterized protein LOC114315496 [Camellia sinensis]|uniref:uncharacterized protein LOC114315496 n=1 Tax=Camellia sinensis TaxID=4442 RepID=UPI001035A63A|nr:uncharacterized protein LOC114315496 [Camellia sinensis]